MPTVAATPTATTPMSARRHPTTRTTFVSGVVAAVATTTVAAAAAGADVPLQVDGESIPLLGFAQLTLVGAMLGGLMAAGFQRFAARAHIWFIATSTLLTALSCVPSVVLPPDTATRSILVVTHVLSAGIIVPALARNLRP
jgi:hypothetical protein